jgi:hypothetical protein
MATGLCSASFLSIPTFIGVISGHLSGAIVSSTREPFVEVNPRG